MKERIFAFAVGCAIALAWPAVAQAFGRTEIVSRHAEADQALAETRKHEQLEALFDRGEASAALELGTGSIKGVMGFWDRPKGLLTSRTTFLADREWVMAYPMTRYIQAWFAAYAGNIHAVDEMFGEARPYCAQVITDREGNFEFKGLKPGAYVLVSTVPYSLSTYETRDTGVRNISYSPWMGAGTSSPVYQKVRTGSRTYEMPIAQMIEVRDGQVATFNPSRLDSGGR